MKKTDGQITSVVSNVVPFENSRPQNHIHTEADEQKDRDEARWKEERNRRAVQAMLRRYPNGRPPMFG